MRATRTARAAFVALGLVLPADRGAAQSGPSALDPPPEPDAGRMSDFLREASRPVTWAEPIGYSVYDQLRDHPEGWDEDADGYGRRLASHAGRTAVTLTVRHGVAALLDAPAHPVRCPAASGSARLAAAALSPVADLGCGGSVRPAVPRVAARVAGAFAPLAWHQPDYGADTAARGIASGIVSSALLNVAKVLVLGK